MWLLDVNIPPKIGLILSSVGIASDSTHNRGWDLLKNGDLVRAATEAGFICLLTRDKDFAEAASRALKNAPNFSVIILVLPQLKGRQFLQAFQKAWEIEPIKTVPGSMIRWPTFK